MQNARSDGIYSVLAGGASRPSAGGRRAGRSGERVRGERVCGLLEVNKKTKSKYVVID